MFQINDEKYEVLAGDIGLRVEPLKRAKVGKKRWFPKTIIFWINLMFGDIIFLH